MGPLYFGIVLSQLSVPYAYYTATPFSTLHFNSSSLDQEVIKKQ